MDNNRICIICRKVKNNSQFNIEHIIPESTGNKKLTINSLCKECNSKLGKKVDYEITNNIISELDRFTNKIKGKSGKIPNPFRKGKTMDGRVIYCDENLKPRLETIVEFDENLKKYIVSAPSLEEGIKIINKKLKRSGKANLTDEQIKKIRDESKVKIKQPIMQITRETDLYKIEMGFIKIAYEFMYYKIGDKYLKDKQGRILAEILNNYIYKNIESNLDSIIAELPYEKHKKTSENFKKIR